MKEVKHYICETCHTEYNEKSKALECEKSHRTPSKIIRAKYIPQRDNKKGYPVSVDIQMDDGQTVTYKR